MCVEMKCKARCSLQLSQLLDTTSESNYCSDYDILLYERHCATFIIQILKSMSPSAIAQDSILGSNYLTYYI